MTVPDDLLRQAALQHAIAHFMAHYHTERNHQDLANQLLRPVSGHLSRCIDASASVECSLLPPRSCLNGVDPLSGQYAFRVSPPCQTSLPTWRRSSSRAWPAELAYTEDWTRGHDVATAETCGLEFRGLFRADSIDERNTI